MRLLERHVLREHLLPFLLGFSVVTFALLLQFLFSFLDLLVGKGIPPGIVLKLFLLSLGWITALSVPCGVLVGSLMTFGRMSQDNEIVALRSCGVNLARVVVPVLGSGAVVAFLLFLFNNYVLPETNHAFANLNMAIHRKSPTAAIRPGVFIDDFPDKSLLVGAVNNRTGEMKDITIYDFGSSSIPTTIIARDGHLAWSPDQTTLRLDLKNGEIHEVPKDGDVRKYRRLQFQTHTILLRNADAALEIPERDARSERELNIPGLKREITRLSASYREREARLDADLDSLGFPDYQTFERRVLPQPRGWPGFWRKLGVALAGLQGRTVDLRPVTIPDADRQRLTLARMDLDNLQRRVNSYTVEIHKKVSIPFACIVFVLLGAPMGMKARRAGLAASAISIIFFVIYYLFLIGGEQLADRTIISPAVAMWAPNVALGIPGLWLTWTALGGRAEGL